MDKNRIVKRLTPNKTNNPDYIRVYNYVGEILHMGIFENNMKYIRKSVYCTGMIRIKYKKFI